MKNLISLILLSYCFQITAQISEGGLPYASNKMLFKSQAAIPEYSLKKLETEKLLKEDTENPTPVRYSIFEEVNIDLKSGISEEISDPAGTVWKYAITSENANSIQVVFNSFNIPAGAKLFLYNNDYSEIYGAFTQKNVQEDHTFIIADFPGSRVILEYFEPADADFKGIVKIGSIGQAYKNILKNELDVEATNYIDINCHEGRYWQTEKHAVCKITFRTGNTGYLCSGALINNTKNDGTPYFLTANHCIDDSASAKTLVAYFNYEKKSCNGSSNEDKTLTGSNLVTTGSNSDFTLLKLNNTPPVSYQPFYAGWDISAYRDNLNASIHHPEGLEKRSRLITTQFLPSIL
ncbi:MAG: hypothetical protein HC905_20000 [Bacteroidales bacterium]|nr:hypothetical protein [Bacteroidales bacterium]